MVAGTWVGEERRTGRAFRGIWPQTRCVSLSARVQPKHQKARRSAAAAQWRKPGRQLAAVCEAVGAPLGLWRRSRSPAGLFGSASHFLSAAGRRPHSLPIAAPNWTGISARARKRRQFCQFRPFPEAHSSRSAWTVAGRWSLGQSTTLAQLPIDLEGACSA